MLAPSRPSLVQWFPLAEGLWSGLRRGEREQPGGACAPRRPGVQGWVGGWVGC